VQSFQRLLPSIDGQKLSVSKTDVKLEIGISPDWQVANMKQENGTTPEMR
jgi:hypothetical protein